MTPVIVFCVQRRQCHSAGLTRAGHMFGYGLRGQKKSPPTKKRGTAEKVSGGGVQKFD